jgi:hypothetical protein
MKKNLAVFIDEVIKQEINELAVSVEQASHEGLALFVENNPRESTMILYKPGKFREACSIAYKGNSNIKNLIHDLQPIVGSVTFFKNTKCKTWEVSSMAAEKGYGPLMYDIVFSYVGEEGLMSDRASLQPQAKNIWRYNSTIRRNDFDIEELTNPGCFYRGKHSEEFLNYKFVIKNPINVVGLETKHVQTMNMLEDYYKNSDFNIEEFLQNLSDAYWAIKYHGL